MILEMSSSVAAIAMALFTLAVLEVVLGIDNVIFISILTNHLPPAERHRANRMGLTLAILGRALMLACLSWLVHADTWIWTIGDYTLAPRSVVLFLGGVYLIWKSTVEMHRHVETHDDDSKVTDAPKKRRSGFGLLVAIVVMDMVFAVDSVFTAIAVADDLWVMVVAMVIAMVVMIIFVNDISDFIARHPTIKVLALSFLILIGFTLVTSAWGWYIPKAYLYFSMAFSMAVEFLNIRWRSNCKRMASQIRAEHND